MMNAIKTIRNNWKKSVLFATLSGFGFYYAKNKWNDWLLMQAYCLEAKKYGDAILSNNKRPKRVTVFLNPAANGGKGKSLFEKNVAPLLHLAGLEVTLVKTEYEGQAKKYMEVLDSTDAILVAGGDGTLSEVVTGLLRRKDEAQFSKIPLGIIPLGKTNSLAKSLCPEVSSTVQFIAEMAMSSVEGYTKTVDVISIRGSEEKSVYAVAGMEFGAFTDSEIRKKRNWYFGPLKHRLAYAVTSLRYWPPIYETSFSYILPCDGCNRCFVPPVQPKWKWWHFFIPPKREVVTKDYSNIENEECGRVHSKNLSFTQFAVKTHNCEQHSSSSASQNPKSMTIKTTSDKLSKMDFIKQGWSRLHPPTTKSSENSENESELSVKEFTLIPATHAITDGWFIIDSEQFELMNISSKLIPDKLRFYFSKSIKVQLDSASEKKRQTV